ncbi:MAG: hypothetical protein RL669_1876 [Pseudomonadota bacterium]|jgi:nitrous oxide reductase
MSKQQPNSRRAFFTTVAAGGAATAAAVVATVVGQKQIEAAAPGAIAEEKSGYRETEHIRNYYRTTQI